LKVVVADAESVATAKVIPVSSELEKDTPLGNAPYAHAIVPVYNAV